MDNHDEIFCPLKVTAEDLSDIKKCEAVIVREYQRDDGSRTAIPIAWGDADEMQMQADRPAIVIVPDCWAFVSQAMVLVSDIGGINNG